MHVTATGGKEALNLKWSKQGYMDGTGGKEGKEETI